MTLSFFTHEYAWAGGFYELAIELGEHDDRRLFEAMTAIWKHPSLDGCYLENNREPNEQSRILPSSAMTTSGLPLYGLARLPNGIQVPCGTVTIREDHGPDWIVLNLPMGGLGNAYPVGGYPFSKQDNAIWQIPLDNWLVEVGHFVFADVVFQLGLIGHEVSGNAYANEIQRGGIPEDRWFGYLYPQNGILNHFPSTHYDSPFT